MHTILPLFVVIPILLAVFVYVFSDVRVVPKIAMAAQGTFALLAVYLLYITHFETIIVVIGDYEGFLGILLMADSLSAIFITITIIIFFAVAIYSYNNVYDKENRFYWFLLFILEGVLLGLFLTRDFFNIFVLIEVSTVVVVILLMYDRKTRNLFQGMTFLMVNIVVMQFYLFGLGYIYMMTGVLDIFRAGELLDHDNIALPYALIMTSIASKCSLFPMVTWLPKLKSLKGARFTIMAIMSGLQVKTAVYLFIRFQDIFAIGNEFFLIIGVITAIGGIIFALSHNDIRLILAYSTIAQIGLIVVGISLGGDSYFGGVFHIVNHALFKFALFLVAGMICFQFKTNNINEMRGLLNINRPLAIVSIALVFSIAGVPFFNGFASKYFLSVEAYGSIYEWLIILINFGTILIFVRFFMIFLGKSNIKKVGNVKNRFFVIATIAVICLILGIFGPQIIYFMFGHSLKFDIMGYMQKVIIFIISLVIAIILNKYINFEILKPLRTLKIGFGSICVSIGVFFALVLIFI